MLVFSKPGIREAVGKYGNEIYWIQNIPVSVRFGSPGFRSHIENLIFG